MTTKKLIQQGNEGEYHALHSVLLLMGHWQQQLGDATSKVLIAGVLNECVRKADLRIRGYWITGDRVYLVLWLCKGKISDAVKFFYERLNEAVIHYSHHEEIKKELQLLPLFKYRCLLNEDLIRLLIGERIERPYYDQQLEYLKDELGRADYCSLVDYSGAVGPVMIDIPQIRN